MAKAADTKLGRGCAVTFVALIFLPLAALGYGAFAVVGDPGAGTVCAIIIVVLGTLTLLVLWDPGAERRRAEQYKLADDLRGKPLIPVPVALSLETDEQCFYRGIAGLVRLRSSRSRFRYSGVSVRAPLAKGVYYRAGSFRVASPPESAWTTVEYGTLYVTNKRVIYQGSKTNSSIRFSQAVSIVCFEDGSLRIDKSSGQPFIVNHCPSILLEAMFEKILGRPIQSSGQRTLATSEGMEQSMSASLERDEADASLPIRQDRPENSFSLQRTAYIAKIRPRPGTENDTVPIDSSRVMYGGETVSIGDEIFLWFSETQGGPGLAWQGTVEKVETANHLTVLLRCRPIAPLGKADLQPFRDSTEDSAMRSLSEKLYKNSHNKLAALSGDETEFLRSRFASQP